MKTMNKKYFVCANTCRISEFVEPTNIKYTFCGNSLKDPVSNLDFDYNLTEGFFRHIRFYEIFFNEKKQPVRIHCLGKEEDDCEFPNTWLDFSEHMVDINYNVFFLKDKWFDSNSELLIKLMDWAKGVAEQQVRLAIIDSIEEGN